MKTVESCVSTGLNLQKIYQVELDKDESPRVKSASEKAINRGGTGGRG